MKKLRFIGFLIAVFYSAEAIAQFSQSIEFEANRGESTQNKDVKNFYARFDTFIAQIKNATYSKRDPLHMISNFVIFTEEGLIMKDLNFHSAESCKKIILRETSESGNEIAKPWLYVGLESHLNLKDLESIMAFLRAYGIEYEFGKDEDLDPLIKQN